MAALGLYQSATFVAQALTILPGAVAAITFPAVAHSFAKGWDRAAGTAQCARIILWISILCGSALALLAPVAIPLFFGRRFEGSVSVLLVLLPSIVIFCPAQVLASYLSGAGRPQLNLCASAVGAVLTIVLNRLWVPAYGILGAAAGTATPRLSTHCCCTRSSSRSRDKPICVGLPVRMPSCSRASRLPHAGGSMRSDARPLHVLVLPSWTADAEKPYHGVFFREQARALEPRPARGFACVEQRELAPVCFREAAPKSFPDFVKRRAGPADGTDARLEYAVPHPRRRAPLDAADASRHRAVYRAGGGARSDPAHCALWAGSRLRLSGCRTYSPSTPRRFPAGAFEPGSVRFLRRAFDGAAAVITVGQNLKRVLAAYVPPERITVIPNLLDGSFLSVPVRPPASRIPGAPFTFTSIGNLIATKSFDVLLRAFAKAFGNAREVRLEIGGDGPERGGLAALAAQLGIASQVDFRGALSRGGVREAMLRADALVLASSVETFGVVIAEAMALGLPVIATRSGGPEDFVTPECGYLVDCDNSEELARRMVSVRNDFPYSPQTIRERIQGYASPSAVTTALEGLYRQVI